MQYEWNDKTGESGNTCIISAIGFVDYPRMGEQYFNAQSSRGFTACDDFYEIDKDTLVEMTGHLGFHNGQHFRRCVRIVIIPFAGQCRENIHDRAQSAV